MTEAKLDDGDRVRNDAVFSASWGMIMWLWIASGCGSLSYFGDAKDYDPLVPADAPSEAPSDPTVTEPTTPDTEPPTDPSTTETDTGTPGTVDTTTTDTETTGTTGTTVPSGPSPVLDGTYSGTIEVSYDVNLLFLQLNSTCDGTVDFVVDLSAPAGSQIIGSFDCDWPILDLAVQAVFGSDIDGNFDGTVDPVTFETSGTINCLSADCFQDGWAGSDGTTIDATFSSGAFPETWEGSFSASWVGP